MIAQYLSNTNEIGTIYILQKNLELNKAYVEVDLDGWRTPTVLWII